jgi:hypothetical protein
MVAKITMPNKLAKAWLNKKTFYIKDLCRLRSRSTKQMKGVFPALAQALRSTFFRLELKLLGTNFTFFRFVINLVVRNFTLFKFELKLVVINMPP